MEQKIISQFEKSTLLAEYKKIRDINAKEQTEAELEEDLLEILKIGGYEYRPDIKTEEHLIRNLRIQLERLNAQRIKNFRFTDREWEDFLSRYITGSQNRGIENRAERIHTDKYQVTLNRSDGSFENIRFIDKIHPDNNFLQVINQYRDTEASCRYDVTILVNGLPMVQIELKKSGVPIKEAFFQMDRYKRDSFSSSHGLFEFIQVFVISNGANTKYYSNTTYKRKGEKDKRNKSFQFTSFWTDSKNQRIDELQDFAQTFLHPRVIKRIIAKYCVFDCEKILKILRPYQIEAIEKIKDRVEISTNHKITRENSGGFIWHTTGSGKTLTSFKASQLVMEIPEVQKVLFVVDRKDLDSQTCQEYENYETGSVDSIKNSKILEKKLTENTKSKKIIVTTIQKLYRLLGPKGKFKDKNFNEKVVIIIDECHRSQAGEMHTCITKHFKNANIFGFTGTPIIDSENKKINTDIIFGQQLHSYKICDAITDENVLPFHYEYVGDKKGAVPDRKNEKSMEIFRRKAVEWLLKNFKHKSQNRNFNSIFATDSIDSAIKYHKLFEELQRDREEKLKVAIIYSSGSDNEKKGQNVEETYSKDPLDTEKLIETSRQYLEYSAKKYGEMFNSQVDITMGLTNYHTDISKKMKNKEIDILIVVNMFLTGFDAPGLNTLFVDKNLKEHGLIQAFSRTNRIYNDAKKFGNIVSFENLEKNLEEAIRKFAGEARIVRAPNFEDCYDQYKICWKNILEKKFPLTKDNMGIRGEGDEIEFCNAFGKFLRLENVLKHYSQFLEAERLSDADVQNYKSKYLDIRDKIKRQRDIPEDIESKRGKSDGYETITFEMDILDSQTINVDWIIKALTTIKITNDPIEKENLLRIVKADLSWRKIYDLFEDYIENQIHKKDWMEYLREKKLEEIENIIHEEKLKRERAVEFIEDNFRSKDEYLSWEGTKLVEMMPPLPFSGEREKKKDSVKRKIERFFDRFKGRGI